MDEKTAFTPIPETTPFETRTTKFATRTAFPGDTISRNLEFAIYEDDEIRRRGRDIFACTGYDTLKFRARPFTMTTEFTTRTRRIRRYSIRHRLNSKLRVRDLRRRRNSPGRGIFEFRENDIKKGKFSKNFGDKIGTKNMDDIKK